MIRFFVLLIVLAVVSTTGCRKSVSPYEYVAVSGRVTYDDGTPLSTSGCALKFYALDAPALEGMSPRPAQANLDASGAFDCITSYKYGDGLIPGRHRVAFFYATDAAGRSIVPHEYTLPGSSPLIVDTADAPLEIKVPRP